MPIFCNNCGYTHGEVEPCPDYAYTSDALYEYGEVLKEPPKWYWTLITTIAVGTFIGALTYSIYSLIKYL